MNNIAYVDPMELSAIEGDALTTRRDAAITYLADLEGATLGETLALARMLKSRLASLADNARSGASVRLAKALSNNVINLLEMAEVDYLDPSCLE